MRIVFMGTPDFAVPTLQTLAHDHEIASVYTRSDKPSGRGRVPVPSPVSRAAAAGGIPVRRFDSFRAPDALESLRCDAPDVIVVAAFGAVLPQAVLDVPPLGCFNVHASLLPRWRGAAPIQRAILAHDEITGVSIMRMEAGLDTGPWCAQSSTPVRDKYAAELTIELAEAGARLMSAALPGVAAGELFWHEQDESRVTYATKLTAADVALDPGLTVADALARVRAAGPSAPCRATVGGRKVTVLTATVSGEPVGMGAALCAGGLYLGLADGAVEVQSLVPEGRGVMDADSFLRGARLEPQCVWSRS